MSIEVIVKDKEVRKLFTDMKKRSINFKPLMTLLHSQVHTEVMRNFRLQSAPPDILKGGTPGTGRKQWKPLSSYTKAARLGSRGTTSRVGSILEASGYLKGSMGKASRIGKNYFTYGTSHGLLHVHQFGKTIVPVRAKVLALPYPGVTGRPRQYSGLFVIGKSLYRSVDGELQPMFFFKDKVKIPARTMITLSKKKIDSFGKLTYAYLTKLKK